MRYIGEFFVHLVLGESSIRGGIGQELETLSDKQDSGMLGLRVLEKIGKKTTWWMTREDYRGH